MVEVYVSSDAWRAEICTSVSALAAVLHRKYIDSRVARPGETYCATPGELLKYMPDGETDGRADTSSMRYALRGHGNKSMRCFCTCWLSC